MAIRALCTRGKAQSREMRKHRFGRYRGRLSIILVGVWLSERGTIT